MQARIVENRGTNARNHNHHSAVRAGYLFGQHGHARFVRRGCWGAHVVCGEEKETIKGDRMKTLAGEILRDVAKLFLPFVPGIVVGIMAMGCDDVGYRFFLKMSCIALFVIAFAIAGSQIESRVI